MYDKHSYYQGTNAGTVKVFHIRFTRRKTGQGITELGGNARFCPRLCVGIERGENAFQGRIYKLEETTMPCVGNKVKIFGILRMKEKQFHF